MKSAKFCETNGEQSHEAPREVNKIDLRVQAQGHADCTAKETEVKEII